MGASALLYHNANDSVIRWSPADGHIPSAACRARRPLVESCTRHHSPSYFHNGGSHPSSYLDIHHLENTFSSHNRPAVPARSSTSPSIISSGTPAVASISRLPWV